MRTTLDIDNVVLALLKERQKREGTTLGKLVSELLAKQLAQDEPERPVHADVGWIAGDLGPFKVDLEDKDAVYEVLDRESGWL